MLDSLIQVLFIDKYAGYILSSYLIFIVAIAWLVGYVFYQQKKLKNNILKMDSLKKTTIKSQQSKP